MKRNYDLTTDQKDFMIVMTLLVRDEEDIIDFNIRYHLSMGVDHIIATDNCSVDGTAEILKSYEKQGVLTYVYEGEDTYSQGTWVTRMARMAYAEYQAEWVINSDADEFWWPLIGTNLKEALISLEPSINAVRVQRHNFPPTLGSPSNSCFHKEMLFRQEKSLNSLGKPLPPKIAHRGSPDIIVAQGNHSVKGIENIAPKDGIIEILHFPVRSYDQLVNKITLGGAAYKRNSSLGIHVGGTWRQLYEEYISSGSLASYYQAQVPVFRNGEHANEISRVVRDERLTKHLSSIETA